MRPTVSKWWVAASSLLLALAWGCNSGSDAGPEDSGTAAPRGPTITIQGYAFSPAELTVDAGTTIAIVNRDSMAHTVTSEAKDDDFVAGAVSGVSFDTGPLQPAADPGGGGGPYGGGYVRGAASGPSITIPASTPSGTVIPYFCNTHKSAMATPNGHITVR
jgi:plastocyanin